MDSISEAVQNLIKTSLKGMEYGGVFGKVPLKVSESYIFLSSRLIYGLLQGAYPGEELGIAWQAVVRGEVYNLDPNPLHLGDDYYLRWTAGESWKNPSNFKEGRVIGVDEFIQKFTNSAAKNIPSIPVEAEGWKRAVAEGLKRAHFRTVLNNRAVYKLQDGVRSMLSIEDISKIIDAAASGQPLPFDLFKEEPPEES